EVKKILLKNNYKVLDLAIKYGSITTFSKNYKYEITSLRKDIKPDGRHTKIQLTNNWLEDSLRRDFTINAIYCDKFGKIFDPVNGIKDLKNKKVNFIGSPDLRIKEDYLRILRFIRFTLEYNSNIQDHNIIRIINKNIRFLKLISQERLFIELKKILELKSFFTINNKNYFKKIINQIYKIKFFDRLNRVQILNKKLGSNFNYLQLLSILLVGYDQKYKYFSKEFRLSNKDKDYLNFIYEQFKLLKNKQYSYQAIRRQIYFYNKDLTLDFLNFIFCIKKEINLKTLLKYRLFIKKLKVPRFPISGDFLIKKGFKQGKKLGKKLEFLEDSWIKSNFKLNLRNI
ncbi:MAG: CCA tRNA nucleotidyltransferase, partial [Proteobacteria bacterium]|nr:CCA tRNA nucleotidyltransferase [Candidatus Fonsibacter sp. PEL4]NBZ97676.1 CCA tRNA nucleotidyltransferase [Candidatus Fonsibacter sp. PEL4]